MLDRSALHLKMGREAVDEIEVDEMEVNHSLEGGRCDGVHTN